ncbi:MAG: cobalamin-dependent protein [Bradymonadales bacterium]|nr:cobalamin-dependent protein [Bradymonadales bacterium]
MTDLQPRLLLTSVMRPLGPPYGDAQSVGYELLHAQVTRSQGMFSPRAVHQQFSLDYIAENLENPTVVLHYPSRRELIRELKKGYDYVGISFIVVTYHRMKEVAELVRRYSPQSRIVLGGYGTVLPDEALEPWGDHICRGEGVAFMRDLLGQEPLARHKHPMLGSRLKVFSKTVSYTGIIVAGLGCPNGCDFCSTSHFFKRKHIKLLETGSQVYEVVKRHLEVDPQAEFTVLDEEFLLNRQRAMEFRERVLEGGVPLSIFVFASVKALSLYEPSELLEMGIDGVWIGFEGERAGYAKRVGKPLPDLFRELHENGITILASMIVGFDYQTPEIIEQEMDHLVSLRPDLSQITIYNPNPGTPLYDRVVANGLLRERFAQNSAEYWHVACGFTSLLKHPHMSGEQIESAQMNCFRRDFHELGPSIYRVAETMLNGYLKHRNSDNPMLRARAARFGEKLKNVYPAFLPGELFGPTRQTRQATTQLKRRVVDELGRPTVGQRVMALLAIFAALWTALTLRFHLFQNPSLTRRSYRVPARRLMPRWLEEKLAEYSVPKQLSVVVQVQGGRNRLRVRLEGVLEAWQGERIAERLSEYLKQTKVRLILDLEKLTTMKDNAAAAISERLVAYRHRIRVAMPKPLPDGSPSFLILADSFKACR